MAQHDPQTWFLDQLMKSTLFHQKVHEWGLLTVADAIEKVKGEQLTWSNLTELGISQKAWDKVVHRGIKPVTVFAHPQVLMEVPRATSYYRMLAMVSQKSMRNIGLPVERYETTDDTPDLATAEAMARRLNHIISSLVEADEEIDKREFAIWRGMAAGAQAQGSWQNLKGTAAEESVKNMVRARLKERGLLAGEKGERIDLHDGR
ncbi:MAG: XcyI family restriction endonuclease, partial [Armatimonadota bacterium]